MGELESRFILHWREMAGRWGVSPSVAQIHALLFLSPRPLEAAEIGRRLDLARSNISTGLRELRAWGLVRAVRDVGDRRNRYEAVRGADQMLANVVNYRRRREIDPTIAMLRESLEQVGTSVPAEPFTVRQMIALLELLEGWSSLLMQLAELPAERRKQLLDAGGPSPPDPTAGDGG